MILGIGMSAFKKKSGMVAGVLSAGGGAGGIITPVIIGFIAGRAGFYGGFIFLALLSASAMLVMRLWGRPPKEESL
jgi:nitrate/nitrite transporter NarK